MAHGPDPEFTKIYQDWFHEVCRWARARGCPEAELEDVAQEVFLVVRRKLAGFDGGNLAGWLYRITAHTTSDQRRRAWLRRVFLRPGDTPVEDLVYGGGGPAEALQKRESGRIVQGLLDKMSAPHRTAFALFEIEGYSGEEIAVLEGIPVATVWTRLHHARKSFLTHLARQKTKEDT